MAGLHGRGDELVLNVAGHGQFAVWNGVTVRVYHVDGDGGVSEDEIDRADERISVGVQAEERESNRAIEAMIEVHTRVIDRHQEVEDRIATLEGHDRRLI